MSDFAIRVEELGKRYRLLSSLRKGKGAQKRSPLGLILTPFQRFNEILGLTHFGADDRNSFWALREVGFEVKKGEVLGIIGHNGAGKSTLLKILSRITAPSEGRVTIRGRVSSLLEVGTGFHPELTGRENIYMNGTLHGMSKGEIDAKLDAIIDFSGVEQYIDMPIKRYSSGMGVRLGFAVAAFLEPEILIVDEVLAVGDAEFRRKSGEKMEQVAREGRTVLFVSHNLGLIESMCSRAILLEKGRLITDGNPSEVIEHYLSKKSRTKEAGFSILDESENRDTRFDQTLKIVSLETLNREGKRCSEFKTGQPIGFKIGYRSKSGSAVDRTEFMLTIKNSRGNKVAYLTSQYFESAPKSCEAEGFVYCHLDKIPLGEGDYHVDVGAMVLDFPTDRIYDAIAFHVNDGPYYPTEFVPPAKFAGEVMLDHRWSQ
jgi:lipopolysaccharide transport system ATP-binding protein